MAGAKNKNAKRRAEHSTARIKCSHRYRQNWLLLQLSGKFVLDASL